MSTQKQKKSGGGWARVVTLSVVCPVVMVAIFAAIKTKLAGDPLSFMWPNFLMFTPFRYYNVATWAKYMRKHINKNITYGKTPITEIDAADYSYELLKKASDNFRYPVVVRGLFNDTPAMKKWDDPEYLNSKIGDFNVPVVRESRLDLNLGDRYIAPFREPFTEIVNDPESRKYLFFPVNSRFETNGSDSTTGGMKQLRKSINAVAREDLELDRIWKGFGSEDHKTYVGAQFIIGQGKEDLESSTGTGWHCAIANNWFIQVFGRKRWYFMDTKYSAYMSSIKGGRNNMQTGTYLTSTFVPHLQLRYADINAGDLLYNPDWEWHTIQNYEGFSFAVPMREFNVTLSVRNNLHFTSVVAWNNLLALFGIEDNGFAPVEPRSMEFLKKLIEG